MSTTEDTFEGFTVSLRMRLALGLDAPLSVPELATMLRRSESDVATVCKGLIPVHDGRIRLYRYREVEAAMRPVPTPASRRGASVRGEPRRRRTSTKAWDL